MWKEFLRTLLAFLIVSGTLVGIAFGVNLLATWVSGFGLPEKTTFFLFGLTAGVYIKEISLLIAGFADSVWQRIFNLI